MIKAANLPITSRHEKWLALPEYKRKWSPAALLHAERVLKGEIGGKRVRDTPYRASSTGKCHRYQQFRRIDLPQEISIDTRMNNIFVTGDFYHLKWQMMGLTEGWLIDAEVPVISPDRLLGGTMDGVLYDDSLFEFKSINSRGFSNVITYGPLDAHKKQTNSYMYAADKEAASILYEDKNSGDWREIRVFRDEEIIKEIIRDLEDMNDKCYEVMVEPLSDCQQRTGNTYRQCPFRDKCLEIYSWEDVKKYGYQD